MYQLIILIFLQYTVSSPINNTIISHFKEDKLVCEIFKNDKLLNSLEKISLHCNQKYNATPPIFHKFDYVTLDSYFCMGLYDIAIKICEVYKNCNDTNQQAIQQYFKQNSFDVITKNEEKGVCNYFKENGMTSFKSISNWTAELYKQLHDINKCQGICIDGDSINKQCTLLYLGDSILKSNKASTTSSNVVQQNELFTPENPKDIHNIAQENLQQNHKAQEVPQETYIATPKKQYDINSEISSIEKGEKAQSTPKKIPEKTVIEETPKIKLEEKKPSHTETVNIESKLDIPNEQIEKDNEINFDHNPDIKSDDMDIDETPLKKEPEKKNEDIDEDLSKQSIQPMSTETENEKESYMPYFLLLTVSCFLGYCLIINKQKIMALAVEGRPGRTQRRRPNTANYRKLDSNLEEAVTSGCNTSTSHVIY